MSARLQIPLEATKGLIKHIPTPKSVLPHTYIYERIYINKPVSDVIFLRPLHKQNKTVWLIQIHFRYANAGLKIFRTAKQSNTLILIRYPINICVRDFILGHRLGTSSTMLYLD